MSRWITIPDFDQGPLVDRPAATANLEGAFFFVTDATPKELTYCNGSAWETVTSPGAGDLSTIIASGGNNTATVPATDPIVLNDDTGNDYEILKLVRADGTATLAALKIETNGQLDAIIIEDTTPGSSLELGATYVSPRGAGPFFFGGSQGTGITHFKGAGNEAQKPPDTYLVGGSPAIGSDADGGNVYIVGAPGDGTGARGDVSIGVAGGEVRILTGIKLASSGSAPYADQVGYAQVFYEAATGKLWFRAQGGTETDLTSASRIATSGTPVSIGSTAPTAGQVLLTSSASAASWQDLTLLNIGPSSVSDLDGILVDASIGGTSPQDIVTLVDDGGGGGALPAVDGSNLTGVTATPESQAGSGAAVYNDAGTFAYADGTTANRVLVANGAGAAPGFALLPLEAIAAGTASEGDVLKFSSSSVQWGQVSAAEATALATASDPVSVSASAAPQAQYVLKATSATTAAWTEVPPAVDLKSATTTISIDTATAPTSGQVLTATSGTAANWQTPSPSGGGNPILQQSFSIVASSGGTVWYASGTPFGSFADSGQTAPLGTTPGIMVPSGFTKVNTTVWARTMTGGATTTGLNFRLYHRALTDNAAPGSTLLLEALTNDFAVSGNDWWQKATFAEQTVSADDEIIFGVHRATDGAGSFTTYGHVTFEFSA